jgi:hypothetical protein
MAAVDFVGDDRHDLKAVLMRLAAEGCNEPADYLRI